MLQNGVPQGSFLGRLPFILFLNGIFSFGLSKWNMHLLQMIQLFIFLEKNVDVVLNEMNNV